MVCSVSVPCGVLRADACMALINGTPKDVRRRFQRAIDNPDCREPPGEAAHRGEEQFQRRPDRQTAPVDRTTIRRRTRERVRCR